MNVGRNKLLQTGKLAQVGSKEILRNRGSKVQACSRHEGRVLLLSLRPGAGRPRAHAAGRILPSEERDQVQWQHVTPSCGGLPLQQAGRGRRQDH